MSTNKGAENTPLTTPQSTPLTTPNHAISSPTPSSSSSQSQPQSQSQAQTTNVAAPTFSEFDGAFRPFLKLCEKVMIKYNKKNLDLSGKDDIFLKGLQSYAKCYRQTEPEDRDNHLVLFQEIWKKHSDNFLELATCLDEVHKSSVLEWFRDADLVIQFGSNCGLVNKIKIYLSLIYDKAYQLSFSDKEDNSADAYIYYLYKIFKSWPHDKMDNMKLNSVTSYLEAELGLEEKPATTNGAIPTEGIGSLINVATDLMGKMGIKPPEGTPAPNEQEIGKTINNVFQSENTQKMIGDIFKGLQGGGTGGIGDVISNVMRGMEGNTDFKKMMGDSLNQPSLSSKVISVTDVSTSSSSSSGNVKIEEVESNKPLAITSGHDQNQDDDDEIPVLTS